MNVFRSAERKAFSTSAWLDQWNKRPPPPPPLYQLVSRSLKSLSLEGCSRVSDTGVAELAKMSTGLTYLNISRCERVGEYGDRALIQLGRSCHQLKGLDAFGCSHAQVTPNT